MDRGGPGYRRSLALDVGSGSQDWLRDLERVLELSRISRRLVPEERNRRYSSHHGQHQDVDDPSRDRHFPPYFDHSFASAS